MEEFSKPVTFTDESETCFVLNSDYSQQKANKLFKEHLLSGYEDYKIKKIYLGFVKKGNSYFDDYEYILCSENSKGSLPVWIADLEFKDS